MRIDIAEAMICEMILKSIEQDDVKAIEAVLSGGVDPNKPLPSTGFSMLYVAATMPGDHAEVVQVLLNGGARPNGLTHEGLSPLYVAAQQGNSKCMRALIRAGADVNFTTRGYQATPLINASEEGSALIAATTFSAAALSFSFCVCPFSSSFILASASVSLE